MRHLETHKKIIAAISACLAVAYLTATFITKPANAGQSDLCLNMATQKPVRCPAARPARTITPPSDLVTPQLQAPVSVKPGALRGPILIVVSKDGVIELTDDYSLTLQPNGSILLQGGTLTIHNPNVTIAPVKTKGD